MNDPVVIDQDGNPQTWTAVYWHYGVKYEEEFDTPEQALAFLVKGEGKDRLSPEAVIGPDGKVLYDKAQLSDYCVNDDWGDTSPVPVKPREIEDGTPGERP